MELDHAYTIGQEVTVLGSGEISIVKELLSHGIYPAYKVSGWTSVVFETNLKPYVSNERLRKAGYLQDGDEQRCE